MLLFPMMILARAEKSDNEFMKTVYIAHHVTMFRMARALTDSNQDAEDAVSDACMALIKRIPLLRQLSDDQLEAYLISAVKSAVYMQHRKRKSRKEVTDGEDILPQLADPDPAPDSRIIEQCTIEMLMNAIDKLSEEDQTAIRMKYFERCSNREIAEVLGVQEGTVRFRVARARKRIYELAGEDLR